MNFFNFTTTISLKIRFVEWNRSISASKCYSHFSILNEICLTSGFKSVTLMSETKLLNLGNRKIRKIHVYEPIPCLQTGQTFPHFYAVRFLHELSKGNPFIFSGFIDVQFICHKINHCKFLQSDTFEEIYTIVQPLSQSNFRACLLSAKVPLCPVAIIPPPYPWQTGFQSGYAILYSHQQFLRVPIFHILSKLRFFSLFYFDRSRVNRGILLWF